MKKGEKHLSLRIDEELLRQFDYVARYDDRSMNYVLLKLIRQFVSEFESEHGPVPQNSDK